MAVLPRHVVRVLRLRVAHERDRPRRHQPAAYGRVAPDSRNVERGVRLGIGDEARHSMLRNVTYRYATPWTAT